MGVEYSFCARSAPVEVGNLEVGRRRGMHSRISIHLPACFNWLKWMRVQLLCLVSSCGGGEPGGGEGEGHALARTVTLGWI